MVKYILHFAQAIIWAFNETKQIALVLPWERLSDGKGLAGSFLLPNGIESMSSRRLAVPRVVKIQTLRKNAQLTIRILYNPKRSLSISR